MELSLEFLGRIGRKEGRNEEFADAVVRLGLWNLR